MNSAGSWSTPATRRSINLADELGVGVQRIVAENAPSADVYDIAGEVHHGREMIDPATGEGAFVKIAAVIARDQDALLDGDEWTARARDLDNTSLKDYLESLRPLTTDWAIMALDLAYLGEYGLPTSEQSALNLIDIIGVDTAKEFSVYGDSDEAFRIRGGSSSLPDALVAAIGSRAELKSRHELKSIARDGSGVRLTMEGPDGVSEISAERLVLTLPFTKLRQVEGIDTMGLSAEKLARRENARLWCQLQAYGGDEEPALAGRRAVGAPLRRRPLLGPRHAVHVGDEPGAGGRKAAS